MLKQLNANNIKESPSEILLELANADEDVPLKSCAKDYPR